MRDLRTENLKPNIRTIGVAGGTGDGKTEVTTIPATTETRKILAKCVGDTNSTLKERRVVYTEDCINEMIVAVKLAEELLEKQDYMDIIVRAAVSVIREFGKNSSNDEEKINDAFKSNLRAEITTKVNTRAKLSFLGEDDQNELISAITDVYENEHFFFNNGYTIYNTVRNNLGATEAKENSKKFLAALKDEIEASLDRFDKEATNALISIWYKANESLKNVFFKYFNREDMSVDGYYFVQIDLTQAERSEEFIDALFSSNDLRNGGKLSIEVLCSEIVIYSPIHPKIAEMLKETEATRKVFTGMNGKVSLGLYDTRGLFHADSTEDDNFEYMTELLYSISYDGLMLVCPLTGDTNEAKLRELYADVMSKYNKQLPVFVLNNKVDLFIDAMYKELSSDDPLSLDVSTEDLSFEEIKNKVDIKMALIRDELQQAQHKNRKNQTILSLPCYLKKDKNMQREALIAYNPSEAFKKIITEMTRQLQQNLNKIHFSLDNIGVSNIEVKISREKLAQIISSALKHGETIKKVLTPSRLNIESNIGRKPHGNGYNALRRRLKNGYGFTSNINESYFYNCKSFSIDFTGNLRNFVTKELLNEILNNAVSYDGGYFEKKTGISDLNSYILAYGYFNTFDFVSKIVYYNAIIKAENKFLFGFDSKFNEFLRICLTFFDETMLDENVYLNAIEATLGDVIQKAINYHILYV